MLEVSGDAVPARAQRRHLRPALLGRRPGSGGGIAGPRATRTPSATAPAPPGRRRAAAPADRWPARSNPRRSPTSSSPPHTRAVGRRSRCRRRSRPTAGPGLAVLGQARRQVGVVVLHADELARPRARARTWSRGTRGAGRARPPPARPRTARSKCSTPSRNERSVSQFLRSPMWCATQARRALGEAERALQLGAARQQRRRRHAAGEAGGHVPARAAHHQRRRPAAERAHHRVVGADVDRAVVDEEQVGDRRPGARSASSSS